MTEDKLDKLFESIATKSMSILDKILDRLDKKLDDEEFMQKLEKHIDVKVDK